MGVDHPLVGELPEPAVERERTLSQIIVQRLEASNRVSWTTSEGLTRRASRLSSRISIIRLR